MPGDGVVGRTGADVGGRGVGDAGVGTDIEALAQVVFVFRGGAGTDQVVYGDRTGDCALLHPAPDHRVRVLCQHCRS